MRFTYVPIAILALTTSANCFAFDFQNCRVAEVIIAGVHNAHVRLDCQISPRPACASAGNYFGFDKSTEEGNQYLSVVLTAYASDSLLTGNVDNSRCPASQGNVALLNHIRMTK